MANPIFKMMNGGNSRPNMVEQFRQFMDEGKGKNPNDILNSLISSGKVKQSHLDKAQAQARQMQGFFDGLKGMFGF